MAVRSRLSTPTRTRNRETQPDKRVSLHNRLKIFRFLDHLESRSVTLPRRIGYLIDLTRLADMLGTKDFEKASADYIIYAATLSHL